MNNYTVNNVLSVDTMTIHNIKGVSYTILNMLCEGTCFQVCALLESQRGVAPSDQCMRAFAYCRASWAGMPQRLWRDRGTEFLAHFDRYLVEHGVDVDQAALESPRQNGRCERHGGIWKEILRRSATSASWMATKTS